ncbi:competence type IV pilus minor pilin ComGF [Limosilactobacillus mucosae]|uniref:competence type IV pilus minor pilin ComGF n=1 Tax=Limosilactobacillus mucosae TaxID=97478 RepID=UPI00399126F6
MRRSAFTLAESMMALLISMITVLTLGQTVKAVDQVNQRTLDMPTDWYLFVTELELSDRHFSLYQCRDEQHAVLYGAATKKYYELTAENVRIFLRLQHGGGYLPMLYQVKAATFKRLGRQRLEIEVKRNNGYRQAAVICLAASQKQYAAGGDDHAKHYDGSRLGSVSISSWSSKTDSSSQQSIYCTDNAKFDWKQR